MGSLRRLVCVLTLAGCIKPTADVACGDLICPETSVCTASGQCVPEASVSACNGIADGAACQTSEFSGTCVGGVCIAPVCGDNIVEGTEQCDGSVPDTLDCVYYGFDLGLPTCDSCVVDVIDPCVRFGWRLLIPEAATAAWIDGSRIATVRRDGTGVDVYSSIAIVASLADTQLFNVTGNTTSVIAWGPSDLQELDGDGSFAPVEDAELDLGEAASGIGDVQLTEDGTIYLTTSDSSGCKVWAHPASSTWSTIGTFANTTCEVLSYNAGELVLGTQDGSTNTVLKYLPATSTWTPLFSPSTQIVAIEIRQGTVYVSTFSQTIVWNAGIQATYTPAGAQVIPLDSGVFVGGGGGNSVTRFGQSNGGEALDAPIGGNLITDGSNMFIIGNGIYVYSGAEYASRSNPDQSSTITGLTQLGDGNIAMITYVEIITELAGNTFSWNYIPNSSNPNAIAIAGATIDDFYVTDGSTIQHAVNSTPAAPNLTALVLPNGTTGINALWVPPSGQIALIAVGANGLAIALELPSTWIRIQPPTVADRTCDITAITGDPNQALATVTCGTVGALWQLTAGATQWVVLQEASQPLSAVALDAAGDIFIVGAGGGASQIAGGAWTLDAAMKGLAISATSPTDIWTSDHSSVHHYDGTSWSRLGVLGPDSPRVIATDHTIYISGVTEPLLLR